jgi:CheY-like chemotaxis protein
VPKFCSKFIGQARLDDESGAAFSLGTFPQRWRFVPGEQHDRDISCSSVALQLLDELPSVITAERQVRDDDVRARFASVSTGLRRVLRGDRFKAENGKTLNVQFAGVVVVIDDEYQRLGRNLARFTGVHGRTVWDLPPPRQPNVVNRARLQQVFWNLVSNAVKFTPEHAVVRVRVRQAHGTIEVSVSDTGQGIPTALLRSIFEPFRQADTSTTRVHSGLGLGLSIVKHIVEAHGGTASAESAGDGRGATFVVRLPTTLLGNMPSRFAPQALTAAIPRSLTGMCVLVVDDDASSCEVVARQLEYHHATVLTAPSGELAFDVLLRQPVHALLVDIAMPGQDGYAFVRKLRESPSPAISSIPAAAMTAMVGDEDRERALEAGFQVHVSKPVDSATLIRTVASLAGRVHIAS